LLGGVFAALRVFGLLVLALRILVIAGAADLPYSAASR
jgi:hypothetical protein